MLPSLVHRASTHQPLIRFLGRRQWPAKPEEQHPHPFAPPEAKQHFEEFLQKFQRSSSAAQGGSPSPVASTSSSSRSGAKGPVYQEFWQAPPRLWKRDLKEWEIELVQSGGASLR
ncbi:hypothetical protein BD414DRAFT_489684 [Trametes punicea]|nr:hypothetical protein BD414DRAFT_489684 [Trametes punicea]